MGYTKTAAKGVSWIGILRISTRGMSFIKTIILARILVPEQFGAYGVALLVLGFLEVMTETGINVLLIQEKEINKYINSAWLVSIIRGTIIALTIILLTPFIADFFHSPESTLLLYTISAVPFLRGFINPSIVKFQKELNFNKEFWYRFISFSIDAVMGIIFTVITQNPIGIIIGLVAGVIIEIILSYIMVKPLPGFSLNLGYFIMIIHRGKWVTIGGIFNYLFHNMDKIVIGRLLGTAPLGIYQVAYSFSILPITEVADVFARVTFPVYVKIAGDIARLRKAFIKTTAVIAGLTIPFCLLLIFFPKEIVLFVLGEQWQAAIPLLPVLGIFAAIRTISGSSSALFLSVGKQEYVTVVTFVSIVGLIVSIFPLMEKYGLVGAAFSPVIGSLAALPVYVYYVIKILSKKYEKR